MQDWYETIVSAHETHYTPKGITQNSESTKKQSSHDVILKRYNQQTKRCLPAHIYCGTIHYSQDLESNEMSVNGWTDKECQEFAQNQILSGHKDESLPSVATSSKLEGVPLRDISQTQKNKHCRFPLTWKRDLISQMQREHKLRGVWGADRACITGPITQE